MLRQRMTNARVNARAALRARMSITTRAMTTSQHYKGEDKEHKIVRTISVYGSSYTPWIRPQVIARTTTD